MKILESIVNSSENSVNASMKLIKTSYKYNKLKAFKILVYSLSTITKFFLIGSFFSVGIIFLAIAGALSIGKYFDDITLGYLFMGVAFFTIGILVFLARKIIDKQIITKLSIQFFDSKKNRI